MLTAGLSVERIERGRKDKQAGLKPATIFDAVLRV